MKNVKLNLSTKVVKVGTFKINTAVTKEMVDEISAFSYATNYIKKSLVKPMDTVIIKIYDDKCHDNYYKVEINQKLLERFTKIYKITKNEGIRKILEAADICEKNMASGVGMMEESLIQELSTSIDREIIKKLMSMNK